MALPRAARGKKPVSGTLALAIGNWTVAVNDFRLAGKVHRPWAEARLEKLESAGKNRSK